MENIPISRSSRAYSIIEKIEDIFITAAGIAIGLSPLLALL